MIRIDLGKDELQKSPRKAKSVNLGNFKLGQLKSLGKLTNDVGGLLALGVALVLAVFPDLFVRQYKAIVMKQHEARLRTLQEKTDVVTQEITKLQPFQKELESYEQQKKLVRERLDIVRELLASRGTPVNVLDSLGQSLPLRAWLSKLSLVLSPAGSNVVMNGTSYTNEDISDFVDKLSESIYFNEVTLEEVQNKKDEGKVDVRNFMVKAKPRVKFPSFARKDPNAQPGAPPGGPGQPAGDPNAPQNGAPPPGAGLPPGAGAPPGGGAPPPEANRAVTGGGN